MKKRLVAILLITAMLSTMTACGNTENAISTDAVESTESTSGNDVSVSEVEDRITKKDTSDSQTYPLEEKKLNQEETPVSSQAPATATPAPTKVPEKSVAPAPTKEPTAVTPAPTKTPEAPTPSPVPTVKPTPEPKICVHTNTTTKNNTRISKTIKGECVNIYETWDVICADCGKAVEHKEELISSEHASHTVSEGKPATCTEDGYEPTSSCDCGECQDGGDVIPATGHMYHDDCTGEISEDGFKVKYQKICALCGDIADTWWE